MDRLYINTFRYCLSESLRKFARKMVLFLAFGVLGVPVQFRVINKGPECQ